MYTYLAESVPLVFWYISFWFWNQLNLTLSFFTFMCNLTCCYSLISFSFYCKKRNHHYRILGKGFSSNPTTLTQYYFSYRMLSFFVFYTFWWAKQLCLAQYLGFIGHLLKNLTLIQVFWEILYTYIRHFHYSWKEINI